MAKVHIGANQLLESVENLEHIRNILTGKDIDEYYIVIAYGSGFSSHAGTQHIKRKIPLMLKEYKLDARVKHIVAAAIDTAKQCGTHPLYPGLRHSAESRELERLPLDAALGEAAPLHQAAEKPAVSKRDFDSFVYLGSVTVHRQASEL